MSGTEFSEGDGLPEGWASVRLADVISEPLVNGRSVRDHEGGFPVLRLTAIKDGWIDLSRSKQGAWTADDAAPFCVVEGDFLLSRGNGSLSLVGRGGVVGTVPAPVAFPDTMIRVRPDKRVLDSAFLRLIWQSPVVRSQIESRVRTTAGIYKLNQKILEDIHLSLPPLGEQQRIVEALDSLLSRLDASASSLTSIQQRFPKLAGALRNASLGATGDPVYPLVPLSDVLEKVEAGKSFRCEARPAGAHEWGVIKVSAMTYGEFRSEEQKAVPTGHPIDERFEIKTGDILVSRANTREYVGAPVLVGDVRARLLLSDKSLRLVPLATTDKDWLISILSSPYVRRQISALASGTKDSMRNISQAALASVQVPVPPADMQAKVASELRSQLSEVHRVSQSVEKSARMARALRKALLRKAFSGCLVPQNADDEPATAALDRIRAERDARPNPKRTRARKTPVPGPTETPRTSTQQEPSL